MACIYRFVLTRQLVCIALNMRTFPPHRKFSGKVSQARCLYFIFVSMLFLSGQMNCINTSMVVIEIYSRFIFLYFICWLFRGQMFNLKYLTVAVFFVLLFFAESLSVDLIAMFLGLRRLCCTTPEPSNVSTKWQPQFSCFVNALPLTKYSK